MSVAPAPVGGFVGQQAFGYVPDPWRNSAGDPNAQHLAESHFDHGDLWYHHHRRHHHTLHDHHYVEGANENLNLQGANLLATRVIPSDRPAAEQLTMRPDILGRWAFESGAAQYGFGLNYLPQFGVPRPHTLEVAGPPSITPHHPAPHLPPQSVVTARPEGSVYTAYPPRATVFQSAASFAAPSADPGVPLTLAPSGPGGRR